jgi:hypothetical protein
MKNAVKYLLFALLAFGLLYFWHPEILNYHEQNQLFLWTGDYLMKRLSLPGGLAYWLGEFVVQFFYVPWLGALLMALLLTGIAAATHLWIGLLVLLSLADIDTLMGYYVALLLAAVAARLARRLPFTGGQSIPLWADLLLWPALYWLIGPMAYLYGALRLVGSYAGCKRMPAYSIGYLIYMFPILAHRFCFAQWPLKAAFLGLYYSRMPLYPAAHWLLPLAALLAEFACSARLARKSVWRVRCFWAASAMAGVASLWPLKEYDPDQFEVLRQDMLVRQERWDEVIARAEKHQPQVNMSSEYVNLALAMKRQLAERMFQFYQSGPDALIMRSMRDNMSNMATAEAFYRLGMVNSALRYCSDLQESIVDGSKSGRLERRIAVCQLANGRTAVARKHLDLLSHSLYYRAEAEELIQKGYNAEVKRLQRLRYREDMLYDYPEIDKMLGLLFVNNPDNKMALDYFLAQLLLKGDVQNFMGHLQWAQQYGGYAVMPAGYQDAVRTIQSHGSTPGTLYGEYVKKMLSTPQTEMP